MTNITSREIQLVSRPNGMPTAANFAIAQTQLKPLQDGQVLVRNRYISEFEQEVGGYFQAGKLKNQETVVVGSDITSDSIVLYSFL